MPYTNKSCAENGETTEIVISDLYPERRIWNPLYDDTVVDDNLLTYYEVSTDIGMTMDILAQIGRLSYTITLLEKDHGEPLKKFLLDDNLGTGYNVTVNNSTVVVACGAC